MSDLIRDEAERLAGRHGDLCPAYRLPGEITRVGDLGDCECETGRRLDLIELALRRQRTEGAKQERERIARIHEAHPQQLAAVLRIVLEQARDRERASK